jgi:Ca2+/Na+ antiporter
MNELADLTDAKSEQHQYKIAFGVIGSAMILSAVVLVVTFVIFKSAPWKTFRRDSSSSIIAVTLQIILILVSDMTSTRDIEPIERH